MRNAECGMQNKGDEGQPAQYGSIQPVPHSAPRIPHWECYERQ
jgi:hypothetical protein